jgi:hypothetical protein
MPPVSPTTSIPNDRIIGLVSDPRLFSARADERLHAARTLSRRAKKSLEEAAADWPDHSPGSLNAWLLFVTTKPPIWQDNLVLWKDLPPTLGEAHENFFYPDPLGFWAEVRRWANQLVRLQQPNMSVPDTLGVTTLVHINDEVARFERTMQICRPRLVLFLDEPSSERSGLRFSHVHHYITDPHRPKQVYEGFWGKTEDGVVVGKAPQHPTTHNLYRAEDMSGFLRSAPIAT